MQYMFPDFEQVNQIEIGEEFAYVTVTVPEQAAIDNGKYIGIDLNTTSHVAVASNPETGKVWKLGKQALHIHKKYRETRRSPEAG
jgi:transposase